MFILVISLIWETCCCHRFVSISHGTLSSFYCSPLMFQSFVLQKICQQRVKEAWVISKVADQTTNSLLKFTICLHNLSLWFEKLSCFYWSDYILLKPNSLPLLLLDCLIEYFAVSSLHCLTEYFTLSHWILSLSSLNCFTEYFQYSPLNTFIVVTTLFRWIMSLSSLICLTEYFHCPTTPLVVKWFQLFI